MVVADDVRVWVSGELYTELLGYVVKKLGLSVSAEEPPGVAFQFDANKLNLAGLPLDALEVIAKNQDLVCKFVSEKLEKLSGEAEDQEGKSEGDEADVVLQTHAFYLNFLNLYLIELHFLMFDRLGLDAYLKSIRIPKAKKYSAQIIKMYEELNK